MVEKKKALFHRAMPLILGGSLVKQIVIALILGSLTAYFMPGLATDMGFLGTLFVSALKAVAPVLVFVLVGAAIANQEVNADSHIKPILFIYLVGTFAAAATAVAASFLFPVSIQLATEGAKAAAPGGIAEVLKNLFLSVVDNPVHALLNANYIGILAWGVGLGIAMKKASNRTRETLNDLADGVEFIVHVVIRFAPVGIYGLVSNTFATEGFGALVGYAQLLVLLVGCFFFVALVLNPIIVWICTRKNPYPLTLITLRESGVMAFFTRSSAANIPVNMNLCRKLKLPEDTFGVSIPLGATINMDGTAIYQCVATIFLATCCGMTLTLGQMVTIVVTATLASIGTAGTPGAGMIMLAMVLQAMNIPVDMIMIIYGVDRLFDMGRTCLNITGDISCALCVTKWESKKTAVK